MPDDDEKKFQAWYARIVKRLNKGIKDEKDWVISNKPDDWQHYYDYRSAFRAGVKGPDSDGHWPSKYKDDLHKNRFVGVDKDGDELPTGRYWDTKTEGTIVDEDVKGAWDRKRTEFEKEKEEN